VDKSLGNDRLALFYRGDNKVLQADNRGRLKRILSDIWSNEFEESFRDYFQRDFNNEDEYLAICFSYHYYTLDIEAKEIDTLIGKDRKQFMKPFKSARDRIKQLFDILSPFSDPKIKDREKILQEIDKAIEAAGKTTTATGYQRVYRSEAKRILKEAGFKKYKIDQLIADFNKFRFYSPS